SPRHWLAYQLLLPQSSPFAKANAMQKVFAARHQTRAVFFGVMIYLSSWHFLYSATSAPHA
ncbi:hypothetical protein, partial [Variovorax sp. WDL1]|uniref:hypothetical protein n=1 Tax=Variovorax sp. WDL1 TaxID=207745 RepID=UPI001E3AC23D